MSKENKTTQDVGFEAFELYKTGEFKSQAEIVRKLILFPIKIGTASATRALHS